MYYKVYLNNKMLLLTDDLTNTSNAYIFGSLGLDEIIHRLQYGTSDSITLYSPNIKSSWNFFQEHFDVIEAAGGLVTDKEGNFLFIYRNGKWDLPKGKMEKGEDPSQTALREVREECGIKHLQIEHFLFDTYHLFTENKKKRLKITHWYKMIGRNDDSLIPQTEEGIEKVEWIDLQKHPDILKNSYENIKMLFDSVN
jgi:8-oxo-dGTP pyrophosphatase MutT (NUDIX family)